MEGDPKTPPTLPSSGPFLHGAPQTNLLSHYASRDHDGKSANRSGCIQEVNEKPAKTQEPERLNLRTASPSSLRRNVSPTKRDRETSMVQVSQSLSVKLMKADMTHKTQNLQKSTSDFSHVPELETKNEDQECRMNRDVPSCCAHNVDASKAGEVPLEPDAIQSDGGEACDMDPIPKSPSPVKGWVIGPLFQSFKSKMASFTEIVMSPVKLFKPTNIPQSTVNMDFPKHLDTDQVVNSKQYETVNLKGLLEKLDENECLIADTEAGLLQNQDLDEKAGSCTSLDSNQGGLEAQGKHSQRSRGRRGARKTPAQKQPVIQKHPAVQKHPVVQELAFDLKSHHLLGEDECAFERRPSIIASNEQNDSMTEKETNNNDSVPCKRSRLLQSSIKPGLESTELSSPSLSSQPSEDTSASCESKLKPNIQMVEQVGLTAARRRPSRRKQHVGHRPTTRSGSSKIVSCDMPCNSAVPAELHSPSRTPEIGGERNALKCDSQSTMDDSKDAQSSVLSSVYYTPPESMTMSFLDDSGKRHSELHGNLDVLVCGAQSPISVKNSPEKTSTDNGQGTAPDMGDSIKSLPQQVEESEGKHEVASTKRERKLKVTALTDVVERNVEKRKRARVEECKGQLEREGLAGVESSTLASLDHKERLESVRPRMLRQQGSAKYQYQKLTPKTASSTTVDVVIRELPETITTLIKQDKGTGRKGNVKLNVSLPAKTTTCITGLEDPTVMKSTDSLTEGNTKGKRTRVSKEQDCFSSTKRLKQQKNTCYSHSESGSTEMNTTPTVKPTRNDPNSGGFGQDIKRRSETSRTRENVHPKNRNLSTDETKPSRNRRKCCTAMQSDPSAGDEERTRSLPCGASPHLAVKLNKHAVKRFIDDARNNSKESMEEVLSIHSQNLTVDVKQHEKEEEDSEQPGKAAAELRRHVREHRKKPRKVYTQKRRRRALSTSKVKEVEVEREGEDMHGVSGDQLDVVRVGACATDPGVLTRRLRRSQSCPEILSLLHHDSPWNTSSLSPHRGWTLPLHRHPSPHAQHAPHHLRSSRRARRHTVCSVEVEREIAPLCLRKEVYPTRRCSPYGNKVHFLSPSVPLSPSMSLSAQASRFLSSPLAFLSKKIDKGVVASPLPPSVFTSSSPSRSSPWHQFPGSNLTTLSRSTSSTSVSSLCNALSQIPLEGESETRLQSEYDDGDDMSCSSQEFESMGMREEKALSDSDIKMGSCKNEERGKVSSIRICRTLPKRQKNLTPMGLPRPVRLKKKEFSLEEIYTNKNFTKPPEGRLETIFELPLNRRNGSQSLIGQKRLKRFVEFPEVGVARKPRKSLVGAGKVGMTSTVCRPRRGNVPNSKDDPPLTLQDIDSLLCSKLDELDYWLALNQETS